jgi:hypothetical protein
MCEREHTYNISVGIPKGEETVIRWYDIIKTGRM